MYVCICNSVTDRDIRDAAGEGIASVKHLCRELGISLSCGHCAQGVRRCLEQGRDASLPVETALSGSATL